MRSQVSDKPFMFSIGLFNGPPKSPIRTVSIGYLLETLGHDSPISIACSCALLCVLIRNIIVIQPHPRAFLFFKLFSSISFSPFLLVHAADTTTTMHRSPIVVDYEPISYVKLTKRFGRKLPSYIKSYLCSFFPIVTWIHRYNLTWLLSDIIAGVTVGIVVVPQGMGYAKIAELPPVSRVSSISHAMIK